MSSLFLVVDGQGAINIDQIVSIDRKPDGSLTVNLAHADPKRGRSFDVVNPLARDYLEKLMFWPEPQPRADEPVDD